MTENEEKADKKTVKKEKCCHRGGLSGAFILIIIGVILLLNNFGILPWSLWENLWYFWPVLLILWGLDILGGSSWLTHLIFSIIGILLLAFVVIYSISLSDYKFDRWLQNKYPKWEELKRIIPEQKFKSRQKVFRCDPYSDECYFMLK